MPAYPIVFPSPVAQGSEPKPTPKPGSVNGISQDQVNEFLRRIKANPKLAGKYRVLDEAPVTTNKSRSLAMSTAMAAAARVRAGGSY